jgi:type IV pilus assembly protein PilV
VNARVASRGMTLIEVLVALFVISIGLLGIAKMQALAISSTRVSSVRSLIAIEAASLASAIHANRLYWTNVAAATPTFTATVNGPAITATSDATLVYTANCATASCLTPTGVAQAAYDLIQWGGALQNVMPTSNGSVACAGSPAICTITVSWQESYVGITAATQYVNQAPTPLSYTLLVQP